MARQAGAPRRKTGNPAFPDPQPLTLNYSATNVPRWCLNLRKYAVYLLAMKRLGKIAVCLAGGLVLNAGARAGDAVSTDNPYASVVVRNVFGLNPPQAVDPNATQVDPPPKITPNGIMSIFGQLQVLFKVAPKPGQPNAKEESYVLSEGQRQDDIEVTHIDEKASLVTFNNHGTVQEIPLANTPASTTPGPAGGGNGGGGIPPPRFGGNRPGGGGPGGHFGGPNRAVGNSNNNPGTGGGPALNAVPTRGSSSGQQQQITPEVQAVMMEIYREQHKNDSSYPTLPPTVITPPDAKNPDGTPVVRPDLRAISSVLRQFNSSRKFWRIRSIPKTLDFPGARRPRRCSGRSGTENP